MGTYSNNDCTEIALELAFRSALEKSQTGLIHLFLVYASVQTWKNKNEPFDRTKPGVDELNKSRIVIFEVAGSEFLF